MGISLDSQSGPMLINSEPLALATGSEGVATQKNQDVPTSNDFVHRLAIPIATSPAARGERQRFTFYQPIQVLCTVSEFRLWRLER